MLAVSWQPATLRLQHKCPQVSSLKPKTTVNDDVCKMLVVAQARSLQPSHVALTTSDVNDAYVETDQESYIRTDDDEDVGNTDWEETRRRWINR